MKSYSLVKPIGWAVLITGAVCVAACTSGRYLKTEEIALLAPDGQANLLLYGCRYPDDIENIAILDWEDDPFTIEIHAPDFSYEVLHGLRSDEAFQQAEHFIECSFFYERRQINRIVGPGGQTVGFEVRPLYSAIRFGIRNVLIVNYVLKGNRIIAYIKLDPSVESFVNDQGSDRDRDGR